MVNFTECGITFRSSPALIEQWGYRGPTRYIAPNPAIQITYDGCLAVCGSDNGYYPWKQSATTITTWILPIIGILLQAPFESNAFWDTCFAIARWAGSPIASLSYVLWNIAVSGKCALMVDMSVRYDESVPGPNTDFSDIRDSFYILMNMNQYSMGYMAAFKKESEGLLRVALFSKALSLIDTTQSLREVRHELAEQMRSSRKKGAVPVFISTMWFLFSLCISIQQAFGELGENSTAHDLALGLLLGWLPVLVLCSIVDRNPISSDDIRKLLNRFVDRVRLSLHNGEIRREYFERLREEGIPDDMRRRMEGWVDKIAQQSREFSPDFFIQFAGQGRLRWHYGAAHPILSDIETSYIAKRGRHWLRNEGEARVMLVLGPVASKGLRWFDPREFWQITAAVIMVTGTTWGAFVLSYFTPTVGLGCRSRGYLVYWAVSFALLTFEMIVWWLSSEVSDNVLQDNAITSRIRSSLGTAWSSANDTLAGILDSTEEFGRSMILAVAAWLPRYKHPDKRNELHARLHSQVDPLHYLKLPRWSEWLFFRPLEVFNTAWLIKAIVSQTFGFYVNCNCKTSRFAPGGGYLDFDNWQVANYPELQMIWTTGTAVGVVIMLLGLVYIVIEWCMQAHISATDYDAGRRGLRRTRRFRLVTRPFRYPIHLVVIAIDSLYEFISKCLGHKPTRSGQRTLVWTRKTKPYDQSDSLMLNYAEGAPESVFNTPRPEPYYSPDQTPNLNASRSQGIDMRLRPLGSHPHHDLSPTVERQWGSTAYNPPISRPLSRSTRPGYFPLDTTAGTTADTHYYGPSSGTTSSSDNGGRTTPLATPGTPITASAPVSSTPGIRIVSATSTTTTADPDATATPTTALDSPHDALGLYLTHSNASSHSGAPLLRQHSNEIPRRRPVSSPQSFVSSTPSHDVVDHDPHDDDNDEGAGLITPSSSAA